MVFVVCGGSVYFDGSAKRGSPPGAGGTADGWYARDARVDDVAVGRDAAVEQQQVAVARRGGRARTPLQPAALVHLRAQAGRRRFVARRARADQPLVIDERVAVGRHEEVVGEHVVARPLPHRQLRAVVVRHHEAARVGHRGIAVVAPAVDLLDILVVPVDRAAHALRQREVERRRVEAERPVRQPVGKGRVGVLAAPCGRQLGERRAVAIDLRVLGRRRLGDAVRAGEEAVEMIEAAVLGVDDDDVLDALEPPLRSGCLRRAAGGREPGRRDDQQARGRSPKVPGRTSPAPAVP